MNDTLHARLLDPDTLAQAQALGVQARQLVEGLMAGEQRSPLHGVSVEFTQHRAYTPGDDLRHLDWKVVGRSDRYVVKQYEQETNFTCHLLLDCSASMAYGQPGATKFDFARIVAACIGYTVLRQRDAIALHLGGGSPGGTMPATSNFGAIDNALRLLVATEPSGSPALGAAIERIAGENGRRGIVLLISDLLDDERSVFEAMRRARFAGHEVIVFHTLHADELELPFHGATRFEGLERPGQIDASAADVRDGYRDAVREYLNEVQERLTALGAHHALMDTTRSPAEAVGGYLAYRRRLTR